MVLYSQLKFTYLLEEFFQLVVKSLESSLKKQS